MKKLIPLTLLTFLLLTTAHALFFAGRSVSNYRRIGGIKIDKMGGRTTGIKKINGINFRKKVFDPREGLVGWWKFDGDATDASGNGNDGTVYGATLTTDREGNSNGAYSFSNATIGIPHKVEIYEKMKNGFTINMYVDIKTFDNNFNILKYRESPIFYYLNSADRFDFYLRNQHDSSYIGKRFTGDFLANKGWVMLTMSWDGSTSNSDGIKIYVDGENIALSNYSSGNFTEMRNPNQSIIIGDERMEGTLLDDIRIYERALTAEEVQLLYEKY